jgi:phytoene dehydrogenase-like protein
VTSRYYDVVVIGTELGPLAAGALLAHRGFRVLVTGQGCHADSYDCWGYRFVRRPFRLPAADAPILRRVVSDLGMTSLVQQIVETEEPAFQVVTPEARVDVYDNPALTSDSLERELRGAARGAGAVLGEIGRLSGEIDKLLASDLVLPPETFFERREVTRAEVQNPFRSGRELEPIDGPSVDPSLRAFLAAPARLGTAGAPAASPLARARQMAGWLFDLRVVKGGRDGLRALFLDHIVAQGGDTQARQRVSGIVVVKGRVQGVRIAGREDVTGCQAVLTDFSPRELAPLVPVNTWTKRFAALVEDTPPPVLGYAINLGLDPRVVPAGLAGSAILDLGPGLGADLLRVERVPQEDPALAALNVSCVVEPGREADATSGALRDAILDRLRWFVPFFDGHLRALHSPWDGFGPLDFTGRAAGVAPPVPRSEEISAWRMWRPRAEGALGVGILPHRTGIRGLLLAGSQVVSGLSVEGELLAAWGAARIAGRLDPGRERVVRSLRSKVEI